MRSFEMTEIVHRGLEECLTEAFVIAMDDCDGVFLSVDIDVCDPGHAPGTGTPEPGGLSARQLLDAVRRICLELPVVGMDVVEVAPPYDHADITAALANRVVLEALSAMARKQQDERDGTTWDPAQPLLADRTPVQSPRPTGPAISATTRPDDATEVHEGNRVGRPALRLLDDQCRRVLDQRLPTEVRRVLEALPQHEDDAEQDDAQAEDQHQADAADLRATAVVG